MRTIRLIWRREWQPTLVFLPEKSMDWGVWQAIVHGFAESATTEHKHTHKHTQDSVQFSSVQLLSRVRLFATPCIAAHQVSLSITNSRNSIKLTSISWWCNPAISSSVVPFSSCPQPLPASGSFQWVNFLHEVAKVLEFQPQYQSFQWTSRTGLF